MRSDELTVDDCIAAGVLQVSFIEMSISPGGVMNNYCQYLPPHVSVIFSMLVEKILQQAI